jgi:hypothetical protein
MPAVRYFLKHNPKRLTALVILEMKWSGEKLSYSTKRTLSATQKKFWLPETQRLKDCAQTRADKSYLYNELFDKLQKVTLDCWYEEQAKGPIPKPQTIKAILDIVTERQRKAVQLEATETFYGLLDRFVNGDIKFKGKTLSKGTLKTYKTFRTILLDYDPKQNLQFDSITVDMFQDLKEHMEETGQSINSIKLYCEKLKRIMRTANDYEYTQNRHFEKSDFFAASEVSDKIYYSRNDIEKLFTWKPIPNDPDKDDPKAELIKDFWILAAESGSRYSDWDKMIYENMHAGEDGSLFLQYTQQKTKKEVSILCSDLFLSIMEKYNNKIPINVLSASFYIKILEELPKIFKKSKIKNASEVQPHSARRSFCTNQVLAGTPLSLLIRMTGHSKIQTAESYVKLGLIESEAMQVANAKKKIKTGLRAVS